MAESSVRGKPKGYAAWDFFSLFHKAIPLSIILGSLVWATQSFAASCAYSPSLGDPLYGHFYFPLVYPIWVLKWADYEPVKPYLLQTYVGIGISCVAAIAVYYVLAYLRGRFIGAENLYGTAAWGSEKDLERNGLLNPSVVLAQTADATVVADASTGSIAYKVRRPGRIIGHAGEVHTLLIAPSRSGKGIGPIFATLAYWLGSCIIFDPKGENFALTAGHRRRFSHVLKFSPVLEDSARFNFLSEIRPGNLAIRDAGIIAEELIACTHLKGGASGENTEHFDQTATDLLIGAILYCLYCPSVADKSLGGVLDFLSTGGAAPDADADVSEQIAQAMMALPNTSDDTWKGVVKAIKNSAGRFISKADRERQSVLSTAVKALRVFEDPMVRLNTSSSDFHIGDFASADHPISLYLTFPYSDMQRLMPVLRLMIGMCIRRIAEGETRYGSMALKHRLLFLLDEFPTLGAFPFLADAMGIMAGFGATFFLICQSVEQLFDKYGQHQPFFDHCKVWATFAPGDIKSAETFSKVAGKESVAKASLSMSGSKFALGLSNMNLSNSEVERNLINPDEIMRMSPADVLLFAHGMRPYLAKKLAFYSDRRLKKFAGLKAPASRDEIVQEAVGLASARPFDWTSIPDPIAMEVYGAMDMETEQRPPEDAEDLG